MIRSVILDHNLSRQLKRLHQSGGTAKIVAEHAEAIIHQWLSGELKRPKQSTRGTHFGEARIKNCLKYDLVESYRLLAVMDGDCLIFLFVGSHDECDVWVCHNSGRGLVPYKKRNTILPVQDAETNSAAEEASREEEDAAEDCLFREIDERDLRIIFSGICRSRTRTNKRDPVRATENDRQSLS